MESRAAAAAAAGTPGPALYAAQLLKALAHLRNNNAFCDVTFKIGDAQFRAHRNVLAAASPYFQVSRVLGSARVCSGGCRLGNTKFFSGDEKDPRTLGAIPASKSPMCSRGV